METVNHIGFIAAAYSAAIVTIVVLIAWVLIDYQTLKRRLADLEMRGFSRRSAPGAAHAESAIKHAKQDA